ncbi:MAG: MBL fold metallo-hydrolase [Candidatus Micrarchaeota archaeon]
MARQMRSIVPGVRIYEERPPDPNNYLLEGGRRRYLVDTCSTLNGNPYRLQPAFTHLDGIILTHPHFDHVAGIDYFPGVPVMAHENAMRAVNAGDDRIQLAGAFGVELPKGRVGRTLVDGEKLDVGGVRFEVISTPGHCTGSLCLFEPESRSLLSGDTVFTSGSVPRVDFPSANLGELLDSYEKLLSLEVNLVLPGHGPVSSNGSAIISGALKLLRALK